MPVRIRSEMFRPEDKGLRLVVYSLVGMTFLSFAVVVAFRDGLSIITAMTTFAIAGTLGWQRGPIFWLAGLIVSTLGGFIFYEMSGRVTGEDIVFFVMLYLLFTTVVKSAFKRPETEQNSDDGSA